MTAPPVGRVTALERRLKHPTSGAPALVAYLTAGFPSRSAFPDLLRSVAGVADAVEIGVPFTDPMADGITIQRTSRIALEDGVTLHWILEMLGSVGRLEAPVLLMSYVNPLLAYGWHRLTDRAGEVDVAGFIVPDLPWEECQPVRSRIEGAGMALVQLVSPLTPEPRLQTLCAASRGFVYAVTTTGTTGGEGNTEGIADYLRRVTRHSTVPVCAGFGIRSTRQVRQLAPHVDGVVIGSALLEVIERGGEPARFLRDLCEGSSGGMGGAGQRGGPAAATP